MSIPFTQFLRPDGRRREITIDRPADIEALAHACLKSGYVFEIEELMTGEVSMEVVHPKTEHVLAFRLCKNGPEVPENVDAMVKEAGRHLEEKELAP